jgi:hypothetical protein
VGRRRLRGLEEEVGRRRRPKRELGRAGWKEREGEREREFGEFFFNHSSTFQTFEI